MSKFFFYFFYSLLIFFSFPTMANTLPNALAANAKEAILIDLSTDTILYEKNADTRTHPSSMTKIMELYLVFDRLQQGRLTLEDTFPVSLKAWKTDGSRMFLPLNSRVSIKDLLLGVIVQSGNDASVALAEGIDGTEENCAQEMTSVARQLGAKNTNFVNATGLAAPNHYSSVRDLAIISKHLIEKFPTYYPLFAEKFFKFNNIRQPNRNLLLNTPNLGCDGIKTGHTDEGGYGIVASAQQNGRRLLLVMNGTASEKERQKTAEDLLNWGFRDFEKTLVVKANQPLATPKVLMGDSPKVPVGSIKDLFASLPRGFSKNFSLKLTYFKEPIPAPLKKGDQVGNIEIHSPGLPVTKLPLVALENVEEAGFLRKIWLKIYYLIMG